MFFTFLFCFLNVQITDVFFSPLSPTFFHVVCLKKATTKNGATIRIVSLDAPNMCPQTKDWPHGNPLPAGSDGLLQLKPGSVFGMGVNLHNNLWNTNYPLYYPYYDSSYCSTPYDCQNKNSKFRLALELKEPTK